MLTCCHSCTDGWCGAAAGKLLCANIGPLYKFEDSLAYYVDALRVGVQQYVPKQRTREEQVRHLLKTSWRIDVTLVKGAAGFPETTGELAKAYEATMFGLRDMPRAVALQLISTFAPTVGDHLRRGCPMGSVACMHKCFAQCT